MLTLQQIIDQADILIPNVQTTADKVTQLNAINNDFFNLVKIPNLAYFNGIKGQANYALSADVRAKNIDYVKAGLLQYRKLDADLVRLTDNTFNYDDESNTLILSPAPYRNGLQGIVRYHLVATTVFNSSNLNIQPDAPAEYHWTYVPALAAWIAQTQDEIAKVATFEAQCKTAWNVAAQNYQKE